MLNHQLGFLEKNQNKGKIKAIKDGYKLITKKKGMKQKEDLEHVCKPLTHVERLEAIC